MSLANVTFGAKRSDPKNVDTYDFKKDPKDFTVYWDVRKGLIPIVGGARETGQQPLVARNHCIPQCMAYLTQFWILLSFCCQYIISRISSNTPSRQIYLMLACIHLSGMRGSVISL